MDLTCHRAGWDPAKRKRDLSWKVIGDTEGEIKRKDHGEREGNFKAKENQMTHFCPLLCPIKGNTGIGSKVIAWSLDPLFLK